MSRERLAALAEACEQIYAMQFNKHYCRSDAYRRHPKWDKAWAKLAALLVEQRIRNIFAFIAVQFAPGERLIVPTPIQCCGARALERWRRYADDADNRRIKATAQLRAHIRDVQTYLERLEATVAGRGWTESQLRHSVLADNTNNLTPLFRYCLGVREKLPGVARYYREPAFHQYLMMHEEYDAIWPAGWITEEFRRAAQRWLRMAEAR